VIAREGMKLFLGLRSLLFLILIPGTVAGYIPWRILRTWKQLSLPALSISSTLAACLALVGICALLLCVWDFYQVGRGTLAPFDPPKHLMVLGLYRLTRGTIWRQPSSLSCGRAAMGLYSSAVCGPAIRRLVAADASAAIFTSSAFAAA
jgi:hypothetical protein